MRYRIDMIHHNPGEAAFDTAFTEPGHLQSRGFNAQAFKHLNTVATFDAVAPGVFPADEAERSWLDAFTQARVEEIQAAKDAGLEVYYHIDLFVLPKRIIEHFKDEITDPETGRVDLWKDRTLELHRVMFEELVRRFPEVDGFIVRVGETYLYDTPYHAGNGAVRYHLDRTLESMQADFIRLLQFLRETICENLNRTLIHRTWDTWPNRFHSDLDFYRAVTDAVEPHPKLVFSVKHTRTDFHRWVPQNPCLGQGQHPQVIEVQCQREYEGKGAYPNYAVKGVIDGFAEPGTGDGLRSLVGNPRIEGVYTWSRGGGWYGPYVNRGNELWCDLNAYVIARFAEAPERTEAELFAEYCSGQLMLNEADTAVLRKIALASLDAVVHGKCCAPFDQHPDNRESSPTRNWMRDDVLHGYDKLDEVFDHIIGEDAVDDALAEKWRSVEEWQAMRGACDELSEDCPESVRRVVTASVDYGLTLFTAIASAWEALLLGYRDPKAEGLSEKIEAFERAWQAHLDFCAETEEAATPYRPVGWHWPDKPKVPGLMASVEQLKGAG